MRLKRLTIMTAMVLVTIGLSLTLFFPTLVFAQDGNGGLDISWGVILAGLISGVLVPLAVQVLTWSWPRAPTWLKALAGPVLAPALALVAMLLTRTLGFPVDFGPIIAIIAGAGTAASVAFTLGKTKGLRKLKAKGR